MVGVTIHQNISIHYSLTAFFTFRQGNLFMFLTVLLVFDIEIGVAKSFSAVFTFETVLMEHFLPSNYTLIIDLLFTAVTFSYRLFVRRPLDIFIFKTFLQFFCESINVFFHFLFL